MFAATAISAEKPSAVIKKDRVPEHFVVREVNGMKPMEPKCFTNVKGGPSHGHTIFQMTKAGVAGPDAKDAVADALSVSRRDISTQGRKDKWALTTQMIAVKGRYSTDRLDELEEQNIWLQKLPGLRHRPLLRGGHQGNFFSIKVHTDGVPLEANSFLNVLGQQRFGNGGHEIGCLVIEGKFEEAASRLLKSMTGKKLRKVMNDHRLSPAAALLHEDFDSQLEWEVLQWQSYLWNELAVKTELPELRLWTPEVQELYRDLWVPKGVNNQIREWYLRPRKRGRPVRVQVRDHKVAREDDGYRHEFTLPPGAFATVFLSEMYDYDDDSRKWEKKS